MVTHQPRKGKEKLNCKRCRAEIPDDSVYCLKCGAKQYSTRRPKVRGNGTGSIYKLKNGSWIAVKTVKTIIDEQGKLHRKTISKSGFRTKREAIEYLPYLIPSPKQRKQISFREIYDLWEPTHKRSKDTMNCYRAALKHFSPVWYEPFRMITVDDLQECMDECNLGKRTKENMKALCGLLYKYAIPRNHAAMNMGQYLVVNGQSGPGKEGLPREALEAIKRAVGTVPYADYVTAQCFLGFRPSEFLALDCKDYDRVQKAIIGGAKTESGKNRTVTISPKIQSIVDAAAGDRQAGPIFHDTDGGPMQIDVYRDRFYTVLAKCGIDNPITEINGVKRHKYTPHSCRHTFATLMKAIQAPDKDKLELIGHTSTEMMRHYQDVDIEGLRNITNLL